MNVTAPDYEDIKAFVSRLPLRWVLMICDTTQSEGRRKFIRGRKWHGASVAEAERDADACAAAHEPGWITVPERVAREVAPNIEAFDKANSLVTGRGRLVMTVSAAGAVYDCVKGD